ncbi:unnamed protein product [Dovyalis caffra]|uniref:Uncharacterized protein n=1 Tax=Dovyalis caffra TaxID=77055 RepID=A0AAV1RSR1_9ROSI|nr:unnamed protein product [Dovyalis caffra]
MTRSQSHSCNKMKGGGGGGQDVPESVGRQSEEETRALVAVRKDHRKKKRGRGFSTAGNNNPGVEWKPTLSAISENNVVAVGERGVERVIKRKGGVGVGVGGDDVDGGSRVRDIASLSGYVDNYR